MSLLKTIKAQLGLSGTPANNFTLDASADNGTMKLARGNAGATTQDIMTVAADGKVSFPQGGVATSGPAFSAVKSVVQSINATPAKVVYPTEEFDTNSCYDTSTSRFTPNVPGYYQINAAWGSSGSNSGNSIAVRKNGVEYKVGTYTTTIQAAAVVTVSALVYLNGSTDYVEIYGSNVTTQNSTADTGTNYFQGFLARAA